MWMPSTYTSCIKLTESIFQSLQSFVQLKNIVKEENYSEVNLNLLQMQFPRQS